MDCTRHPNSERGLSLVEVIIAGIVLLIAGTAISGLLVNSVKSQATLSKDERRIAVAEGIYERLKSETGWMAPAAADCQSMPPGALSVTCKSAWLNANFGASTLANQSGSAQPVAYMTDIRVIGIDDSYDDVRQDDRDGTRPDYYAARVRVRQKSTDKWFTVEGTIDPPGRISTGALSLSICRVTRQYDERTPIAGCPDTKQDTLLGFPAGSPWGGNTNVRQDWDAARDRGRSGGNWDMVSYNLAPAGGVQVTVQQYPNASGVQRDAVPAGWGGVPGCTVMGGRKIVRCTIASGGNERVVSGLIPGRYQVAVTGIPRGYESWPLHSIPSNNTALVEKGRRSRVLQVIRPVARASYAGDPSYDVDLWSCDHSEVQSWGSGPCVNRIEPYGISGYLAPAPSSRAHWSNYASAATGASRIRFRNLAPGLYSARMVTAGKSSLSLHQGPAARGSDLQFLWINPVADGVAGGDAPDSGTASWTRHWCDYDRRVAYLSGVGLGPGGGNVPHTHYTYTRVRNADGTWSWVVTGSYIHQHYYYPATSCRSSGGGGGPPGPGSGGA